MKRNKIKIISIVLMTSIMVCTSLNGCGNSLKQGDIGKTDTQDSQSETEDENYILGKVTVINNDEVTLAIGENTESSESKDTDISDKEGTSKKEKPQG
ncbi:MAG: hypothetical protein Q4F66_09715, partial [Clostridium sp.]|nr:hypothetical protein [Clostridium sp.]